jgi:hypothetical protein
MLIGTLSVERQRGKSFLSGASRRKGIAEAVDRFGPDLLICGGHSLGTNHDLDILLRDQRISHSKTIIVVEVERDTSAPKGSYKHCLYAILPGGVKKRLGRQVFAESHELTEDDGAMKIAELEKALKTRRFKLKGKTVLVLACGEMILARTHQSGSSLTDLPTANLARGHYRQPDAR